MDLTLVTKKNLGLLCLLVSGTKGPAELLTLRNVYETPFIYHILNLPLGISLALVTA